jgi:MFS family permease
MHSSQTAYRRLFRNKSFTALWLGQTISFIGDYFLWLAVPILVEQLTGSSLLLGLSLIFNALPMLLLGPVAGVFVDRWDRRRTMIVADLLRALLVLFCLVVQTPDQVWIYYVVGFLMSCVGRFFFPAQNAVLPLLVPDTDDLLAANGLMQIVQTVGLLVGPALAGFAIGLWGGQVAFVVASATFCISAVAILTMTVPRTTVGRRASAVTEGELVAVWGELQEGVVYLFGNRTMKGVLLCMAVVQLGVGAINVLWVPFMLRTFGLGPEGVGAVDAAQGLGMVVGGVGLGLVAARLKKRAMAGWGIVLAGVMIALMGLAPPFSLGDWLVGMANGTEMTMGQRLLQLPLMLLVYALLLGVAIVPAQSALMTMMQMAVPDLKRGRVGSAMNALTTATGLVSMAAAATLGEVVALRTLYVIAGLITAAAGLVGLRVLEEPEVEPGESRPGEGATLPEAAAD